jgi:hypothetical protein
MPISESGIISSIGIILSGPAASAAGAQHLTQRQDAIVVDMGAGRRQTRQCCERELTRIVRETALNSGADETAVEFHSEDHPHTNTGNLIFMGCGVPAELNGEPSYGIMRTIICLRRKPKGCEESS